MTRKAKSPLTKANVAVKKSGNTLKKSESDLTQTKHSLTKAENTVTKADIAEGLQKGLGIPKKVSKNIVDQVFEEIALSLETGTAVHLSSFGNFETRDKKARIGRNPKTGDTKMIAARRVVTFKAGQKLKNKVQHVQAALHGLKDKI